MRAVAASLFDPGNGLSAERLDRFANDLQDWGRHAGPKTRVALRAAAFAVQWTPLLTMRRVATFTSLSPADRLRHLEALERFGTLAAAFAGIKTVFAILWFEDATDLPAVTRTDRRPMDTMKVVSS